MSETFHVKVRIKRWKLAEIADWQRRAQEQYRKAAEDMWKQPYVPPVRCPSCGLPRRYEYAPITKSDGLIYKQPEGLVYQTWN